MKNPQSELSRIFLDTLQELTNAHEMQINELLAAHAARQQQWEQKVSDLSAQVQDLQQQLTVFSKSLEPLNAQLNSLAALSITLRDS